MAYTAGTIFVQVIPSFDRVQNDISRQSKKWGDEIGKNIQRGIEDGIKQGTAGRNFGGGAGGSSAGKKAGENYGKDFASQVRKRIEDALKITSKIKVNLDDAEAVAEINDIRRNLARIGRAKIGIDMDAGQALAEMRALEDRLERVSRHSPNVAVRTDAGAALAELQAVDQMVEKLDRSNARVKVHVSSEEIIGAQRAANGLVFAVAALGPIAVPAIASATAGILALGTAAASAAAGVGVLAAAFSGIGDAVGAIRDQQQSAADDTKALADAQRASSRRIAAANRTLQDAEVQLARAREDAGQAAEDSARRVRDAQEDLALTIERANERAADSAEAVADAQEALADAMEQASRDIERAAERQADAEERLADVQRDAQEAQEDLSEARRQAARDQEDLTSAIRRGRLEEQEAVYALRDAQNELHATIEDPQASARERDEARINYEQRVLQLEDLQRENARMQEEQEEFARTGIDGTDRVKTAQERLADATRSIADAEKDAADAARDAAEAREDAAERVADAQERVTEAMEDQSRVARDNARDIRNAQETVSDAVRASARQQVDSARAITDAQRSVESAIIGVQDAAAMGAETTTAAMRKVRDSMADLSPAGRAFALFIANELIPQMIRLRNIAQEGMLPGVQRAIETLVDHYGPRLESFVARMSVAIGGLFESVANALTGPAWDRFFTTVDENGVSLVEQWTNIGLNIATAFANIAVAFTPLTNEMSAGFLRLTERFVAWSASLEDNPAFQNFLNYVREVGPKVLELLGNFVLALVAVGIALAPLGSLIMAVVNSFLEWIINMDPTQLRVIATSIVAIVVAFQVLNGVIIIARGLLNTMVALRLVFALVRAGAAYLTTAITFLGRAMLFLATNPIGLVIVGIGLLVAAFVYAYRNSETFREIVQNAIQKVKDTALAVFGWFMDTAVPWMQQAWAAVSSAIRSAWESVILPVLTAFWSLIKWIWTFVVAPILQAMGLAFRIAFDVIKAAWNYILLPVLKFIWTFIQDLWRIVIRPVLNNVKWAFEETFKAIKWVWDHILNPVFSEVKNGLENLSGSFSSAVEAIGRAWDGLKEITKSPVRFMINTVINRGIIDNFNKLTKLFGNDPIDRMELPAGFASGGIYEGVRPGYTPGRDNALIAVGGGEAIIRPEGTRALGEDWVNGLNAASRQGGVAGAREFLGGFASGGVVKKRRWWDKIGDVAGAAANAADMAKEGIVSAAKDVGGFVAGAARSGLEKLLAPIRNQFDAGFGTNFVGKMISGSANRLFDQFLGFTGKKDEETSGDLSGGSFAKGGNYGPPGRGGLAANTAAARQFVVENFGISNIGGYANRNIGGTNKKSDHALGKALDVMISNYKSATGIAQGNKVASWFVNNPADFGTKYVIWRDQINTGSGWRSYGHPSGSNNDTVQHRDHVHVSLFDQGGALMPGMNAIMNLTGRPETVLPFEPDAIMRALNSGGSGSSRQFIINDVSGNPEHVYRVLRQREALESALSTL